MTKEKEKNSFKKVLGQELHQQLEPILGNLKSILGEKRFQENFKDALKALIRGAAPSEPATGKKADKVEVESKKTKKTKSVPTAEKSYPTAEAKELDSEHAVAPTKKATQKKAAQKKSTVKMTPKKK